MAMVEIKADGVQYYDLAELEKRLGISLWTLRRYIQRGELRAQKVGRKYFVNSGELQRLLEGSPKHTKEKPPGRRSSA